ncbi:Glycosyltransferase involved in cell wall bisynthesis [Salegentibacter agarivorans]|uniref:Glycosyltransferase involved in cell wall bisynthesis n=1 Tax=Salegentibacter agarivorans TaxID=345907 RepID=A0A1I2K5L9_9FLAO|nr:glycosyltransferase family 2 protein [Salegentibacter agarivorans]SFF60206.1 Glycosyltransferase involved in cell wall bisynthesis [Salegentibacter agarivorans]
MNYQNKVTLIIPIFNAEEYLHRCLKSVMVQRYKNFEVILINDGSSDNSISIIQNFLNIDNRFRYFFQDNAGPSSARNLGIEKARGKYLSFIDADDWLSGDYIEKLVTPMQNNNPDLVCAGYFEVNSNFPEGIKLHDFQPEYLNRKIDKSLFQSNLFTGVSGVLWGKLFKKEVFIKNNIHFNKDIKLSEDLLVILEYSKYINEVFIIHNSIYYYNRLNENGLSRKVSINKYYDLKLFLGELDKFREEVSFKNFEKIKTRRLYSFMIQLLRNNTMSKEEYYKAADFLVKNETSFTIDTIVVKKMDKVILKNVFKKKYFIAWMLTMAYDLLSEVKNIKRRLSFHLIKIAKKLSFS